MWTPLHLEVDTDYAFVPEGAGFTRASRRLKDFAYWFLPRYNRFMFGLEITGQENLNGITGRRGDHLQPCTYPRLQHGGRRMGKSPQALFSHPQIQF